MIRVIVEDLDTGETETQVVHNDYLLICDGNKHLTHTNSYPTTGTTVLTIKQKETEDDHTSARHTSA